MSTQTVNGNPASSKDKAGGTNTITVPETFKIQPVDGLTSRAPSAPNAAPDPVFAELGVLQKLVGNFKGIGLNMIFRPAFEDKSMRDNVLEYNVTSETMAFLNQLGDVPNRGLGNQADIILRVVPYTQMVSDLLDKNTGKANRPDPVSIHFEQGLFIQTPPTEKRPVVKAGTISRLASVPHGTTINCQGLAPDLSKSVAGAPKFQPASIIPFTSGKPNDAKDSFPQMKFNTTNDLRIPPEVKADGALTAAVMQNPNLFLEKINNDSKLKRIKDHIFFTVSSDASSLKTAIGDNINVPGGGTSNIAFLSGNTGKDGNANAVSVVCDYWISTVEYDVQLPTGDFSGANQKLVTIESEAAKAEAKEGRKVISPTFVVHLMQKIPNNTIAKLSATQIQYSQKVLLDFNGLSWPHISVATLLPSDPVHIRAAQVVIQ